MWIAGLLLCVAGIALVVVGVLGRQGRLPRNMWVGLRSNTIMRTDQTWRVAHRRELRGCWPPPASPSCWRRWRSWGAPGRASARSAILLLGLMIACLFLAVAYGDRAARKVPNDIADEETVRRSR